MKIEVKYKWNERLNVDVESDMPPSNLFMEIGYNRTKEDKIKHYRRFYTKELEKEESVIPSLPFLYENIYRMEKKSTGLFSSSENPADNKAIIAGKFKGKVKVFNK